MSDDEDVCIVGATAGPSLPAPRTTAPAAAAAAAVDIDDDDDLCITNTLSAKLEARAAGPAASGATLDCCGKALQRAVHPDAELGAMTLALLFILNLDTFAVVSRHGE